MKPIFKFSILIAIVILIFGCPAKPRQVYRPQPVIQKKKTALPAPVNYSSSRIRAKIMNEFSHWKGTPHKMGGYSKRGIDCSGFTHYIYAKLFYLNVPRSTKKFLTAGVKIKKSRLQPGDLVMFRPHSYPRHIGIYVGNNKFIHASTSKGVMMSDLDNPYWKKHYKMSRRIIYPRKK